MIERKGCGSQRVNRYNISIDNDLNKKLKRLSVSCDMRPTSMVAHILQMVLDDPVMVNQLQQDHNVHPNYRILPVRRNGITEYMFRERG